MHGLLTSDTWLPVRDPSPKRWDYCHGKPMRLTEYPTARLVRYDCPTCKRSVQLGTDATEQSRWRFKENLN